LIWQQKEKHQTQKYEALPEDNRQEQTAGAKALKGALGM